MCPSQLSGEGTLGIAGHRHGSRLRLLTGSFGPIKIAVPRARIDDRAVWRIHETLRKVFQITDVGDRRLGCRPVELYDWLLALHVLSAFAWIAALVLFSVVVVAGRRLSVPSDVARMFQVARVGDVLIAVGMIGIIVFGIWLALDEYEIWDGWIIAALVLWVVGGGGRRPGREGLQRRPRPREGAAGGGSRRAEPGAERDPPLAARARPAHARGPGHPGHPRDHDLQAGSVTMLATIRPDSWNFPLLLHVFGALILVGGLVTALSAQVVGWNRETASSALQLARLGFFTLLCAALPGWFLMRAGAEWIDSKEGWDDVETEPAWLGIG